MTESKNKGKNKILITFSLFLLILLVISAAYAYLIARVDPGAEASARVVTHTTDSLMFETGDDISIYATLDNFSKGGDNASSTTTATAILKASSKEEEGNYTYNLYLDISANNLEYTTPEKTPELIMKVNDPKGNAVTTIDGLNYNSTLGGFDITDKQGVIPIAENYSIVGLNTTVTQTWNVEIILINLDTSQNANLQKDFEARVLIQKDPYYDPIDVQVNEKLASMTLDEKIAQMSIISFNGKTMSTALTNELALKPGGVILFAGNIDNYANTSSFIQQIKATADIPLFVSVDQEGGRVQRISSSVDSRVQTIPYMREVGYKNDAKLAYDLGKVIAEEIAAFGFNVDFAPSIDVVDVTSDNVIGARSFGGDPDLVSKLGNALYNGILDTGVIPSYKHFPGHGATEADTHSELPVLSQTKEELFQRDLKPFQYVIDHGAELIMVGHLSIPNIDPDGYPASLSNALINGLLKTEMGFNGLVITDSLQMGAITKNYPEKQRYELAINAGVDILLMPQSCQSAITNIKQSVSEGTVTEERINESVRKILKLKYSKLLTDKLPESYIGSDEHKAVINRVTAS